MTAIVERDVAPPSPWVPGYPADLERVVLTALSRDRGRRYPSALHFARSLEEYVVSLGVVATHQSLARYYQQVFTHEERAGRSTGAYRPSIGTQPPAPPRIVGSPDESQVSASSRPPGGTSALDELRALRVQPLREAMDFAERRPAARAARALADAPRASPAGHRRKFCRRGARGAHAPQEVIGESAQASFLKGHATLLRDTRPWTPLAESERRPPCCASRISKPPVSGSVVLYISPRARTAACSAT